MWLRIVVVWLAALAMAPVATAGAHDSRAPAHAPHFWLPKDQWVMEHWVSFDEARLYALLRIDRAG